LLNQTNRDLGELVMMVVVSASALHGPTKIIVACQRAIVALLFLSPGPNRVALLLRLVVLNLWDLFVKLELQPHNSRRVLHSQRKAFVQSEDPLATIHLCKFRVRILTYH
jgi:hypothetical protein